MWAGLIQALGGRKAFRSWLLVAARQSASVCIALRTGFRPFALRSSSSSALTHCMRHACRLRWQSLARGRFFRSRCNRFGDGRRKVHEARSNIRASAFGKFVKALPSPASGPPNKSFKPTPCRRFVETSGRESNTGSHPSRSARLNSGVRRQKSIWQLVARRGKTIGFG